MYNELRLKKQQFCFQRAQDESEMLNVVRKKMKQRLLQKCILVFELVGPQSVLCFIN